MDKTLNALLLLLEDPDKDTFNAISESLIQSPDSIQTLQTLWDLTNDSLALSRLDGLLHHVRFNLLKQNLKNWKVNGAKDIIEGAWLIATYQYHDLTLADVNELLSGMIKDAWIGLKEDQSPAEKVAILNHVLFFKHRFQHDTNNFTDYNNIFINHVLKTRKGSDISLAIIYMGIAQRLSIPIYGVPLPRSFMLSYLNESATGNKNPLFYINPSSNGAIMNNDEIKRYLNKLKIPYSPVFFLPCTNLVTIQLLISYLLVIFEQKGWTEKVADFKDLLTLLGPDSA